MSAKVRFPLAGPSAKRPASAGLRVASLDCLSSLVLMPPSALPMSLLVVAARLRYGRQQPRRSAGHCERKSCELLTHRGATRNRWLATATTDATVAQPERLADAFVGPFLAFMTRTKADHPLPIGHRARNERATLWVVRSSSGRHRADKRDGHPDGAAAGIRRA